MQNNNRNILIAYKLEEIANYIVKLDKHDSTRTIQKIQKSYTAIDKIAVHFELPTLRAIIHWMHLNTDVKNIDQVSVLINSNAYSDWIITLASLLRHKDASLFPKLHINLTISEWIVKPSPLILKNVAEWLSTTEDSERSGEQHTQAIKKLSDEEEPSTLMDEKTSESIRPEQKPIVFKKIIEQHNTETIEENGKQNLYTVTENCTVNSENKKETFPIDALNQVIDKALLLENENLINSVIPDSNINEKSIVDESDTEVTSGLSLLFKHDIHPELKSIFLKETSENIESLGSLLKSIHLANGKSTQNNRDAMRLCHAIKGASGIVEITSLATVTEKLEIIFEHSETKTLSSRFISAIPTIERCVFDLFNAIQFKGKEPKKFIETLDLFTEELTRLEAKSENSLTPTILDNPIKINTSDNADKQTISEPLQESPFQLNWNDDTHPELLMVYLEETPIQISQLVSLLHKIVEGIVTKEETHTASRMAHTIKGASAIVGITTLSELAYRLETLLDHAKNHQLPNHILNILPDVGQCMEDVFEAIQLQSQEPENYYDLFKQLDHFVQNIEEESPEALKAPKLPDFIRSQNKEKVSLQTETMPISENDQSQKNDADLTINEIETELLPEFTNTLVKEMEQPYQTQKISLEKLDSREDLQNILFEFDDIVMNLIKVSTSSDNIAENIEDYTTELHRFEMLTEISGYPELSILSQWCLDNLLLFIEDNSDPVRAFIQSGNVWSWIEYTGIILNNPEDMSYMSSLSVDLMREEWAKPITMDDLQTVLLALRRIDIDPQQQDIKEHDSAESSKAINTDEIDNEKENISWDQNIHPELLAIYFKETPEQIDSLAELLHQLVNGNVTTEGKKKAARISHTIKGASGVLGLNAIVNLTHKLEDILEYSIDNHISRETGELLVEASDCLESLYENIKAKRSEPKELASVLSKLEAFSPSKAMTTDTRVHSIKTTLDNKELTTIDLGAELLNKEKEAVSQVDLNESYLRVPISIIDKLLNMAGELVTTSSLVGDRLDKTISITQDIRNQDDRVKNMLDELSQTISRQEKQQTTIVSNLENSNFDTLEMDSYNELHSIASLISEAVLDSQDMDSILNKQLADLRDNLRELGKLNKDFSNVVLSSRMVAISMIVPRLERIVRQTCRKTGKKAKLTVTGKDISIDTDILNGLVDPLLHMLRNAIDHGIESPETRRLLNKNEIGLLELSFIRDGNNIIMQLSDDGAGIDSDLIYEKALNKALVNPDQIFSKTEKINLILIPGFTTQESVSDISGRGVGMDVVANSVENLNGHLSIKSELGKSTTMGLSIPLTLITNTMLLVKSGVTTLAIPTDTIEIILYQEANEVILDNNCYYVNFNDALIEVVSLDRLLGWDTKAIDFSQSYNVLIIKTEDDKFHAVHIEKILSSREMVIKALTPWIQAIKGVVGACHLIDGGVAPVINLLTVIKEYSQKDKIASTPSPSNIPYQPIKNTPKVLIVDDSLSNRKALSLIIEKTDYEVLTAVDGMDALQIMNEHQINLVFTDLEMPRMNGLDLTQAIRAWQAKRKTPIIMITSRTTTKHRELANEAGVDDYLTKPVVAETLLDALDTWLSKKETANA